MSPDGFKSSNSSSEKMEVPPAVIAQAEAAASSSAEQSQDIPGAAKPSESSNSGPRHRAGSRVPEATTLQDPKTERPIEVRPPPVYGEQYGEVDCEQDGFDTKAKVATDGRVNININQRSRGLSELLVPALRSQLDLSRTDEPVVQTQPYIPASLGGQTGQLAPPPLNIAVHVVGSRGDVQPFVALGKVLKEKHHHRVRLATHSTFRDFVEENGLEFFDIGGDPAELMAFMVKNPGLMPGMDSLRSGDVGKRRKGMYEIVQGCWRSCIEVGDGTGVRASDESLDSRNSFDSGIGMGNDPSAKPFVADAIIANPPSFAHIHCAEKLGIPLHLMFTMPWSPTQAFPHPIANVQSSNADTSITNFVSYALVEMMTWQGLGDIINRFRERSLGLEPVSLMWAPGMASRLRIPYTYCWSPSLIPKPRDWGSHISISGFYFLSLAREFTPQADLAAFLEAGPPPIYIGFGSIVVDDPNAMTKLIFEAVKKTGQRALVSKGWGGFGADALGIPEGVFMLGNVPHDWLFKHVSCVVHHGGAGTTAAGIALGRPTVIVPFFGDQPFWGAMVAKAGAGPVPIPNKQLTAEKLANAIMEALKPTTLQRAQELGAKIAMEDGTKVGAESFHEKLDVESLRCVVSPSRAAVWRVKRTTIRLSAFAATVLANAGLLDFNDLKLYRPKEYDTEDGPWDPFTGGASALLGTIGSMAMGFADFPVEILRALKIKPAEETHLDEASVKEQPNPINESRASMESGSSADKGTAEHKVISGTPSPIDPGSARSEHSTQADGAPLSPRTSKGKPVAPGSLATALKGSLSRSLSRSPSRSSSPSRQDSHHNRHHHRRDSNSVAGQISLEAAIGAGKGVGRIVGAGLKSPMDFTLGLARGFHNAPKLYGDQSVRQADKVTDFQSGLKAAGKEFGFGFYDGISGLVTQPLEGAKKEGVAGLLKGVGKGIGGIVLKPSAAIWGVPGYTFKGIYKEIQRHLGSSVQNYIVAARTAQGYDEWHSSTQEERNDAIGRWHIVQVELAKEKKHARHGTLPCPQGFMKTRHMSFDERKKQSEGKKTNKLKKSKSTDPKTLRARPQRMTSASSDLTEFEEAIQDSVAATSRGDPEEDQMIEKAIRASVLELQAAEREGDDHAALQRAIRASVAEDARLRGRHSTKGPGLGAEGAHDHDRQLEDVLHRSVTNEEPHPLASVDFDDSGIDTDDDENIKTAIRRSTEDPNHHHAIKNDGIEHATQDSKQAHREHQEGLSKAQSEEDVVLEYVKRQSLAEAQYKDKLGKTTSAGTTAPDSEDVELERAMRESLDMSRKSD